MDEAEQSVVIASNALDRELFPLNSEYVRVQTYRSVMVVRAHRCFDEKGLDFVLTYYDNPESTIPSCAYNWIVNHGGPHFLQQVPFALLIPGYLKRGEVKLTCILYPQNIVHCNYHISQLQLQ